MGIFLLVGFLGSDKLSAQDGSMDSSFLPDTGINFSASTILTQPDGKILVAGDDLTIGENAKRGIIRLNIDGSLDAEFNAEGTGIGNATSPSVSGMSLQSDGKIIIAGNFGSYNGVTRRSLTRINTDGTLDETFSPELDPNQTLSHYAVCLQTDGKVLLGYPDKNTIVRLNTDGSLDSSFTSLFENIEGEVGSVAGMMVQPDGKIIAIGSFLKYDGQDRKHIVRINADGSLDETFNPGTGFNIPPYRTSSIKLQQDGKLLIGGYFTSYNGNPANYLVRLNADGSADATFQSASNHRVTALDVQSDGKIHIGGYFSAYGGISINKIARLNADGSLDEAFNPGSGAEDSPVFSIHLQEDGKILATGTFRIFNGTNQGIVRLHNTIACTPPSAPVAQDQSFCGSATVADLEAEGTNLAWYATEDATEALTDATELNSGTYYVSQSSEACESIRIPVEVTINEIPTAPLAVAVQMFEAGATLADLEVEGENLTWYDEEGNVLDPSTPLVDGEVYYVSQTVNGCESETTAIEAQALSIKESDFDNFSFYPNPVNNILHISNTKQIDQVLVFNLSGQLILEKKANAKSVELNLSHLNSATYVVKIVSNNQIKTVKVIKK